MAERTLLTGASVVGPTGDATVADVLIEGGTIVSVGPSLEQTAAVEARDLTGLTLAPGFIDVHVHGGGGFSLITTDPEEIRSYARWAVSRGVTGFLATVCADSPEGGIACLRAAALAAGSVDGGATSLGVNLEGPFVSPDRRGALPPGWLASPDPALLARILAAAGGKLRLMTLAPELNGADAVISASLDAGVRISVGHTDAKLAAAAGAFAAGASHVTHAFNAMRPLHHREPSVLGAALRQAGVSVEVIADGVHLHPATVELLVRSFGSDRVCLVTDAVSVAGLEEGTFEVGGQAATLDAGSVRLPDGTIAGSAATMGDLVRNLVEWGIANREEAIRMASATPARGIGIGDHKGAIAPGYDADLVALSPDLGVEATWVAGIMVFGSR